MAWKICALLHMSECISCIHIHTEDMVSNLTLSPIFYVFTVCCRTALESASSFEFNEPTSGPTARIGKRYYRRHRHLRHAGLFVTACMYLWRARGSAFVVVVNLTLLCQLLCSPETSPSSTYDHSFLLLWSCRWLSCCSMQCHGARPASCLSMRS